MLRPWHYSLELDKTSAISIHQQLIAHFRTLIEGGSWLSGSALPSSRDIAQQLGINRKTVSRVYEELSAEGLIYTLAKRGTFVSERARISQTAAIADPPAASSPSDTGHRIFNLIQKHSIHHVRRAALHMHKLQPVDYDVTGLFDLKHRLANMLAHECRYLVAPENIACGSWQALQSGLWQSLPRGEQCLLIDHSVSAVAAALLQSQGIRVLRLPDCPPGHMRPFVEQIEKFCINYPVAALWCDSSLRANPAQREAEHAQLIQKLSDYEVWLIEDRRTQLPDWNNGRPLAATYARSYLLGSLYGTYCDRFNLSYIASQAGLPAPLIQHLDHPCQQTVLLNMLAQSELIKRGEYKKLLSTIHRSLQPG